MATGEDVDEETLGGAEMHSRVSGVSDYLADDERDAIRLGREIVAHLNWRKRGRSKRVAVEAPRYDPDELLGIASPDVRKPFDVREVIARIVDGSRFSEFKPLYGTTLVSGWAHLHGYPVGILANNGILFSESAQKGAQFIQLCNQTDMPLLFLQNITGFMVGSSYEQGGIIKHGAKLINAVSNSTVPQITIMIGAIYGAGNYAMCGRAYEPRFLFTLAEPPHRGDGRQAARRRADDHPARRPPSGGEPVDEARTPALPPDGRAADRQGVEPVLRDRAAVGRRHHRPARHPHGARDRLSAAYSAPIRGTTRLGRVPHVRHRRAFRILFVCLVCIGLGQSMLFAILPPAARALALSPFRISTIFAASASIWVFVSPWWGRRSDVWGRRPVILIGLLGYGLSMALLATTIQLGAAAVLPALAVYPLLVGVALRVRAARLGDGTGVAGVHRRAHRTAPSARPVWRW